ncbi:MAG TPA: NAD(P)H-dependent oxidoreductase subunit E [Pirellulales bacterium]|nr:NAD(P)H-dependent oxidoreductase subunit E [Pirellulales bacterium]
MATPERVLTDEMVEAIKALFPRYPTRQAVTLPALHIVNERLRYVPIAAVVEIARLLDLAPAEVQDTLSFYGFFKQDAPHGRTRAWVCRSISCALRGGEEVLEHMCHTLGVKPGETTKDGRVTLEFGECLGACDFAPCMLAGKTLYKDLTIEKADAWMSSLSTAEAGGQVEGPDVGGRGGQER